MSKKNLSVSAIDNYSACPLKFKYQNIEYRYRVSNEHFIFGTFGHRIVEMIVDGLDDDIINVFIETEIEKTSIQNALETLKISDPKKLAQKYISMVRGFLKDYDLIGSEIKARDEENNGIIDCLLARDGKLLILDWKFTNYMKNEDDITGNLQLYMYAKLLESLPNINEIIKKYKIKQIYLGYFSLSKAQPTLPKKLASGKLSKAADKRVTYDTYMEAIKEYGLDTADYQEHLDKLKNKQENDFINFVEYKVSRDDLENKIKEIRDYNAIINFSIQNNHFPGRNSFTCGNCDIVQFCKNRKKTKKW